MWPTLSRMRLQKSKGKQTQCLTQKQTDTPRSTQNFQVFKPFTEIVLLLVSAHFSIVFLIVLTKYQKEEKRKAHLEREIGPTFSPAHYPIPTRSKYVLRFYDVIRFTLCFWTK